MRKLLYVLLAVKLLSAVYVFFSLLTADLGLAIISAIVSVLEIALVIAVIKNMDEIEELWYNLNRIRHDIKVIDDNIEKPHSTKQTALSINKREVARGAWDCVKCATVNKGGTTVCTNCGAEYSAWTNPTLSPHAEKKYSKWIK